MQRDRHRRLDHAVPRAKCVAYRSRLEEQTVQASYKADEAHHSPHGQQRTVDVGLGTIAGVMSNGESLVGRAENRLEANDIAWQTNYLGGMFGSV